MKKSTKLVSAVVVLAVLGGVYVGLNTYVTKEESTESSSEEGSKTEVYSAKTDDIKSLEFIIDKKDTVFEKKDDSWVKKDETAFPVNQTTLDSAASALEKVEADRVLENVDDLTEYGLDSPSNSVTVTTDDGTTKFNIGDENTSTNQYYIAKDDEDSTVYVVSSSTVTPFMNSLYDYAQGEDFPTIDSSTVKKVQVSQDEDSYILEENSDGATWDVSTDGSDKETADTTAAGNVTSGLGSLAYDQFTDYNAKDLSKYGLDSRMRPLQWIIRKRRRTTAVMSLKAILRRLRALQRTIQIPLKIIPVTALTVQHLMIAVPVIVLKVKMLRTVQILETPLRQQQ